ncbi:hypothetical protein FHT86_001006 [Rhizobium sp. BK313]|uniref:hypothetical protein n=1 Tax=Rhizobium sp. BK313 TaxID=2587081 RepID=UPI00106068EF|nr:hypothetical protein [Rhizobium sp. BK313]MBB3452750.1 hypothetical protein [Rhizobium sp. BK313]
MTKTTDFIAELVRAANEVEKLGPSEKRRLLERGLSMARALRELILKTGKVAPINVAVDHAISGVAENIEEISNLTVSRSLLALAEEIRRLRILNNS